MAMQDNKARIKDAADDVEDTVNRVGEKAGQQVEHLQHKAEEKVGELENAIRRNPLTAAAAAVGIGFIFGAILSR